MARKEINYDINGNNKVKMFNDIDLNFKELEETLSVAMKSNGFTLEQFANTNIAFDDATRTLTISAAEYPFSYYDTSIKYEQNKAQTTIIDDVEGLCIIYFNNENLAFTNIPTEFLNIIRNEVLVALVYWNADDKESVLFGEERHGCVMDCETHLYAHQCFNTQYVEGLGLTDIIVDGDGNLDASAQFGVEAGVIHDEDIKLDINTFISTQGLPIFYKINGGNWRKKFKSGFSLLTDVDLEIGVTGRIVWNEYSDPSWGLTTITNNDFILMHIYATNEINSNAQCIAIMGENRYATQKTARVGANEEMKNIILSGLPSVEYVPIASIIFQCSDSYTNQVKSRIRTTDEGLDFVDWRGLSRKLIKVGIK